MKILIVGIGKLGYQLAKAFSQKGNDVIAMDKNAEVISKVEEHLDVLPMLNNGFEVQALKEAHIKNLDLTISVTDDDETNLLVAFIAKRLGSKRTIARVRNPEYDKQAAYLKAEMGIDMLVNPDLATSKEIERYLTGALPLHTEEFEASGIIMADVHVNNMSGLTGKTVAGMGMPKNTLIVAVARDGEVFIPYGSTVIGQSDTLYLLGARESIYSFYSAHNKGLADGRMKDVTILGGGRTGYYLAQGLLAHGIAAKVIENDKARCQYLAEKLKGALIIHGDATDVNLLEDEGVFQSDALVSLTGFDEENLLISLLAKQRGVNRVIAKVSRSSYVPLIERLGVEMAINPVMITAAEIMRFTQLGNVLSLSLLAGGRAELTELIVEPGAPVLSNAIGRLGIPKGMIIGCIVRKGKAIVPDGGTTVLPGDQTVVFTVGQDQKLVEKFFRPARK